MPRLIASLLRRLRVALCCALLTGSLTSVASDYEYGLPLCLPEEAEPLMSVADGAPLLCLRSHDQRKARCWSLNVQQGSWKPFNSALIPGYSLKGNACRQWGYCIPASHAVDQAVENGDDLAVLSLDRKTVVVISHPHRFAPGEIALFEAHAVEPEKNAPKTEALLRRFSYHNPPGGGGIGNSPREAVLVNHQLFVAGQDAGPSTTVTRIPLNGGAFARIDYPPDRVFNMDEGLLRLLDDRTVVIRNRGYVELTISAEGQEIRARKLPWPASCSAAQFKYASEYLSGYHPEGHGSSADRHVGKSCAAALGRLIRGYWDAGVLLLGGKRYVLENVRGEIRLMMMDGNDRKQTLLSRLPRCRGGLFD